MVHARQTGGRSEQRGISAGIMRLLQTRPGTRGVAVHAGDSEMPQMQEGHMLCHGQHRMKSMVAPLLSMHWHGYVHRHTFLSPGR
jgi:hypothetical protein